MGRVAPSTTQAHENIEDTFPSPMTWLSQILSLCLEFKVIVRLVRDLHGDWCWSGSSTRPTMEILLSPAVKPQSNAYKEKNQVRLQPENQYMEPIYARDVSF